MDYSSNIDGSDAQQLGNSSPFFLQGVAISGEKVYWTVSRDLRAWIAPDEAPIFSGGFETTTEVVLPREWEKAFFRVQKLNPAGSIAFQARKRKLCWT